MTVITSRQVVLLFTPEIHFVTSSTITGTSTLSSLALTEASWWVELDIFLVLRWPCLSCLSSSFLERDLLLVALSLAGLG